MFELFRNLPALALAADPVGQLTPLDAIASINKFLNNIVWGWPALILLAFVGVFMTCRTKFFQISHFGHWMKQTIGSIFHKEVSGHTQDQSISQFQSLCTALAATVGTATSWGWRGPSWRAVPGPCSGCGSLPFSA